jgi:hypothetical protein
LLDLWLKPFAFGFVGTDKAAHVARTIPKLKLELCQPPLTLVPCLWGGWHKDALGWLGVIPTSRATLL